MVSISLTLLSVGTAIVPMVLFLFIVWRLDRYDREPVWLVALTFLWGAIGAVGLALVIGQGVMWGFTRGATAVMATGGPQQHRYFFPVMTVLIAPLVEEPAKALFLLGVVKSRHFDNTTDGFVYGAAVGLGFGMTENFLYFMNSTDDVVAWGTVVFLRTFYSAVMHATASALVGASMGVALYRGTISRIVLMAMGLAMAILVHGLWNGMIAAEQHYGGNGDIFDANLLIFMGEFCLVFCLFQACLLVESFSIRRELLEEEEAGMLPVGHADIISSVRRRSQIGWLPAGVDQEAYVTTANDLAKRKDQLRKSGSRSTDFHRDDVVRLRGQICHLLAMATEPLSDENAQEEQDEQAEVEREEEC